MLKNAGVKGDRRAARALERIVFFSFSFSGKRTIFALLMLYYNLAMKFWEGESLARKSSNFLKATFMVTLVIIISKAVGFVREMVMAHYFGTGLENDAYVAAYGLFYLPILLFNSCITSTLIPIYIKARERRGLRGANRFASNTLNLFCAAALIVAALMYFLAGPLVRLVYPGFDPGKIDLTVRLTQIMMLSLVFNVASIVLSSLLNAEERFITAQLTGFPLSFAIIVACAAFSRRFGIEAVAVGVVAAGILQVLILLPGLHGVFHYRFVFNPRDRRFRRLLAMALPALLAMAVSELNHMIDNLMTSGLPEGSLSALSYAYKLITFITGILVVPLTTVVFSKMSRMAATDDKSGVLNAVRTCVELIALVVLPVTAIVAVLNHDVITFAYNSGRFNADSVRVTAGCFLFYVIGVPSLGMRDLLNRTFHSIQDTKTPFYVSVQVVVLNILLDIVLRGPMGANGLALATTLSGLSGMITLFVLLKKRFGKTGLRQVLPELGKIAIALVACVAMCLVMRRIIPVSMGRGGAFLKLALSALAAGALYVIVCLLLRVRQLDNALDMLLNRGKGRR